MHASNYHRVPPGAGRRTGGAAAGLPAREVEERAGLAIARMAVQASVSSASSLLAAAPAPGGFSRRPRLICLTNRDGALIV